MGESMLDGSFVKEIAALAKKDEVLFDIEGKKFSREGFKRIYDDPRPSKLVVNTLSGIVDYLKGNVDGVEIENCLIKVDSPESVTVYSPVQGESHDRHVIIRAVLDDEIKQFRFNQWVNQEEFIISILALFKETKDREKLLEAASNMTASLNVTGEDNGNTTDLKATSGVILGSDKKPPAVANLKPYRTFIQAEQPESSFLFRYRKNDNSVALALFEADGGAWRTEAIQNIQDYILKELPACFIIS